MEKIKKYHRVITYGTFDMFHIGHLNLLKKMKSLANEVVVAVSTDEFNKLKGKESFIPFEHRRMVVESIKYVDKVISENSWEQKLEDIKKYNVDLFIIGDDWKGKFDYLNKYCDVLYIERTKNISTTLLKNRLNNISKDELLKLFDIVEKLKKEFL